jgi:hypothetical protein
MTKNLVSFPVSGSEIENNDYAPTADRYAVRRVINMKRRHLQWISIVVISCCFMLAALQYVEGTAAGGGLMESFGPGNKVIGGGAVTNAVGPADLRSSGWWGALPDQPADGFLSTASGSAIYSDTNVIPFGTGEDHTFDLAFGDADGDGYLDLAVGNHGENKVYWNNGDGTFDCGNAFEGGGTFDVDWGHMNEDDDLDLVVANGAGQPNLVCLNNGDRAFTCTSFSTCSYGSWASCYTALGDVDSDGDLDIALGIRLPGDDQDLIYYNDGTGTSFPITTTTCTNEGCTRDLEFGNIDKDNDLDLVVVGDSPDYVCINDGTGTFTETRWLIYRLDTTLSVALYDADDDNDLDIAAGEGSNHPIEIYQNNGEGYFTGTLLVGPVSDLTFGLAWGDVDKDGDPDLAAGNIDQPNVVYFNDPVTATNSITFTRAISFGTVLSRTRSVAFGDVDNDSDLDLAVGNDGQQNVVYINTLVVAPAGVGITGPTTGRVDTAYTFIATVRPITVTAHPITATLPITYVWQATEKSSVTHIGGLSDTITFTWPTPGIQTITVTATNAGGAVTGTHFITLPVYIYLPNLLKNYPL